MRKKETPGGHSDKGIRTPEARVEKQFIRKSSSMGQYRSGPLSSYHDKYDLTRASETELQCREIDFRGVHPSQQVPSWTYAEHTDLNSVRCCKMPSLDLVCTELCSEPQEERLGLCESWKGSWPLVRECQGPTMVWIWIKGL